MTAIAEAWADYVAAPVSHTERDAAAQMATYALDTIAVTLAGTVAESSRAMSGTVLAAAGRAEATVFGVGKATSAWDAALANGTFAHALELDDDHRIAVLHPGAVVVPAAFAAAEAAGSDGPTFLRALLIGYEIACRLGLVFRGSQFHHGVHPTALCGVFGAAAAAGVCFDLGRDAFTAALGIAGTQAFGLTEWRSDGSWIKRLHAGKAAHAGVLSARLAAQGFTGPATIFEGPGGFFNAFSFGETIDPSRMTDRIGEDFVALGTAVKPYPCCRFGHGLIDLAIAAHEAEIATSEIEAVGVRLYRTGVLSYHRRPANAVDAQFNVPYAVAVALLRGRVVLSDFTAAAIGDQEVLAIADRVTVEEDDAFTAAYPEAYRVELQLRMRDGREVVMGSACPSGDPEAERYAGARGLLHEDVVAKVAALLPECGFADRVAPLVAAAGGLSVAPDIKEISALVGAAS